MSGYFPSYVLEVIANGLSVVALWNDWPAHRSSHPKESVATNTRINAMVVEGTNVLRVLAQPIGDTVPETANVHVRLYHMLAEDDKTYLFGHTWRAAHRPLVVGEPVEIARHETTFVRTFGRWRWEDSRAYMPDDRASVIEVVKRARDALARRDFETYVDMFALKLEETARATGRSAKVIRDETVQLLSGFSSFEGWDVNPIEEEAMFLESCAGGRLVIAHKDESRAFPIEGWVGGTGTMAFGLTLSHVDGTWQPVR